MFTTRAQLEGKWPIAVLTALSVATILGCPVRWAPIPPLVLLVFTIAFFRDPEANVPAGGKLIVAPATGNIVEIKTVNESRFLGGEATMVAIFPIISNTTLGLRSVDPGLINLFRMNRAGRLQTLVRLRIPSALPYFFGGLRISSGLALIGAVVGEFVAGTGGRSSGLAYEILQSGFALDIPRMFAALFLITVAGVGLFVLMVGLSRLTLGQWHESEIGADM